MFKTDPNVLGTVYCVLRIVYIIPVPVSQYCYLCIYISLQRLRVKHFCALCTMNSVLCTVYYVLCTVHCVIFSLYCALCTTYSVLCTLFRYLYPSIAICTSTCPSSDFRWCLSVHCELCTLNSVLWSPYCVHYSGYLYPSITVCTSTSQAFLCTMYSVLCTLYCVLCTLYYVLCTV